MEELFAGMNRFSIPDNFLAANSGKEKPFSGEYLFVTCVIGKGNRMVEQNGVNTRFQAYISILPSSKMPFSFFNNV